MTTPAPPVRVAVTADLHYGGRHTEGTAAAHTLAAELYHDPPDLFVLAGDIGAGDDFARCLDLFADLPGHKALVPGNHDVWVRSDDDRGDSLAVYRDHLPRVAADRGFHYLDAGPLVLPEAGFAVVGSMNWYDYSWGVDRLAALGVPDWQDRLRTKRFLRGRHNDANFVRWEYDDASFTRVCVATLADHLRQALKQVPAALLVTHHPVCRGLNYPKPEPWGLDDALWECFSGNMAAERLLAEFSDRVPVAVCGHTHSAREGIFGRTRGYNVGGDYGFKRLLRFDWPAAEVTATEFHAAGQQVA